MHEAFRCGHRLGRYALPLILLIQSAVLFPQLGLLPIWGDEYGTLRIAALPLDRIFATLQADYHPPSYYLLVHFWFETPLPGSPIERVRALSVLFALLATVVVDRLWLRGLGAGTRLWFLLLWAASPCLILYARMGRSYTLQMLLGALALYAAACFLRNPRSKRALLLYAASAACLLYTHYAPGLAVIAGVPILFVWKLIRDRRLSDLVSLAVANLIIGACYLPWLRHLTFSAQRTVHAGRYSPTNSVLLDRLVGLAYWFVSFGFGENLPAWAILLVVCLIPLMAWVLWSALRHPPQWFSLILPVAIVGFAGVSKWVSFAFVPARLLFLLPFYLLLLVHGREKNPKAGTIVCSGILCLSIVSIHSYYQKGNFLNKAYVLPNEEIAAVINRHSSSRDAALIVDSSNTNVFAMLEKLPPDMPVILLGGDDWAESLDQELRRGTVSTIWLIRNTHEISHRRSSRAVVAQLAPSHEARRHLFVPYSALDRLAMRVFGWHERPSHVLELLEMRRRAPTTP